LTERIPARTIRHERGSIAAQNACIAWGDILHALASRLSQQISNSEVNKKSFDRIQNAFSTFESTQNANVELEISGDLFLGSVAKIEVKAPRSHQNESLSIAGSNIWWFRFVKRKKSIHSENVVESEYFCLHGESDPVFMKLIGMGNEITLCAHDYGCRVGAVLCDDQATNVFACTVSAKSVISGSQVDADLELVRSRFSSEVNNKTGRTGDPLIFFFTDRDSARAVRVSLSPGDLEVQSASTDPARTEAFEATTARFKVSYCSAD